MCCTSFVCNLLSVVDFRYSVRTAVAAPLAAVTDDIVTAMPVEQTHREDLRNLAIVAHVGELHVRTTDYRRGVMFNNNSTQTYC